MIFGFCDHVWWSCWLLSILLLFQDLQNSFSLPGLWILLYDEEAAPGYMNTKETSIWNIPSFCIFTFCYLAPT